MAQLGVFILRWGGRGGYIVFAFVALYIQVQLMQGLFKSENAVFGVAVPFVSLLLGIAPSWVHMMCRERRWFIALFVAVMACTAASQSFTSALGRVNELRANKGADAKTVAAAHREAKDALERAEANEQTASASVDKWCNQTVNSTTSSKVKKRTETTTEAKIAPQCEPARTELAARREATETARTNLTRAMQTAVPEASADVKGVALFLGVPDTTVERYQPALLPITIELAMAICFALAFRPLPELDEPLPEVRPSYPANVAVLNTGTSYMKQPQINGLVAAWIHECGMPEGLSVSQARAHFNEWLKTIDLVSLRAFGEALTANKVPKRKSGGRVMIGDGVRRRKTR